MRASVCGAFKVNVGSAARGERGGEETTVWVSDNRQSAGKQRVRHDIMATWFHDFLRYGNHFLFLE